MNPGAVIMMIVTMSVITTLTTYFFIKVLRAPPKPPDVDTGEAKGEAKD